MARYRRRGLLLLGFVVILAFWVLVLVMLPSQAWSDTFYAAPLTSTNNINCDAARNITTPVGGANVGAGCLQSGDTLILLDGDYNECMGNTIPGGLSATQPTTVRAANRRGARFTGSVNPCGSTQIRVGNRGSDTSDGDVRHYITIDGIVFAIRTNEYGGALTAQGGRETVPSCPINGSHHIVFINNEVYGGGNSGNVSSFTSGIGQGGNGHSWTIAGNYFHDLGLTGADINQSAWSYAMYISGGDNLIENNEIARTSGYAFHGFSSAPQCTKPNHFDNNIFRNNYIHDTGGAVLLACGGQNNQIYNNIIVRTGIGGQMNWANGSNWGGIRLGTNGCAGPANGNLVYNNTVLYTRVKAASPCVIVSWAGGASVSGNVVKNNICWGNRRCADDYCASSSADDGIDNNASGSGTTILDHNLATGPGGAVYLNPLFVTDIPDRDLDAAPRIRPEDFKLQSGSPALGIGADVSSVVATDFAGTPRPQPVGSSPDLGAWEMGGAVVVVPQDPIAWWPFDEASGTTAQDITGNLHHLTLTGGPTFGPGRIGAHGLVCDGATGGMATTPVLTGLTQYTWTAWLKGLASPVSTRVSVPFFNGTTGDQFGFAWDHTVAADRQSAFHHDPGAYNRLHIPQPPLLAAGAWTHIASTWDGSTWILYVGGVEKDRRTGLSTLFAPGGSFSVCSSAGASPWSGTIDELKLWGRALSATEVANEVAAAKKAVRHTVVVQ
jgi:hypothetical protein